MSNFFGFEESLQSLLTECKVSQSINGLEHLYLIIVDDSSDDLGDFIIENMNRKHIFFISFVYDCEKAFYRH